MIWDFAVRPTDLPGAHFFTVYNPEEEDERIVLEDDSINPGSELSHALAAPQCDKTMTLRSWTASNPSAYLIDSGLWTACWESRDWMKMRYQPESRHQRSPAQVLDPNQPVIGTLKSQDKTQRLITYPGKDLFCLQPFNPDTICWTQVMAESVPMFSEPSGCEPAHIAFEFEGAWKGVLDEWDGSTIADEIDEKTGMAACVASLANVANSLPHLWFIDSDLRRLAGAAPVSNLPKERRVFSGNGCKFVEVHPADGGWNRSCSPGFLDRSAHEFIRRLQAIMMECWDISSPCDLISSAGFPELGVLACVPDL
ncbi:hypothetical protein OQA88_11357 [Cercophora sp. LCS_1]